MDDIKSIQLVLLRELLRVCQSLNLPIYADGGTLLGAVRHRGFIPWDDDIDMMMLRPDYDKLVENAAKEFETPFFFQTAYSEKAPYPRGHAQLRIDNTAAILPTDIDQGFHQGIFIDIFPYDAVPDDPSAREILCKDRDRMFAEMTEYAYGHFSVFSSSHNKVLRSLRQRIDSVGFKRYYASYENLFRTYPIAENKTIACLSFINDLKKFQRDKEWYDETILVPFEDIMIPIPAGYDQILTKQYGDYMTPVQAPSYHGGFTVLDTKKSYLEYLPALRKRKKKAIWKERFQKYRRLLHR